MIQSSNHQATAIPAAIAPRISGPFVTGAPSIDAESTVGKAGAPAGFPATPSTPVTYCSTPGELEFAYGLAVTGFLAVSQYLLIYRIT